MIKIIVCFGYLDTKVWGAESISLLVLKMHIFIILLLLKKIVGIDKFLKLIGYMNKNIKSVL